MNVSKLLEELKNRSQAFVALGAEVQKKVSSPDADTDDDDTIALNLATAELRFYVETEKLRGRQLKKAIQKAESLAQGKEYLDYKVAREWVQECCRFLYRIEEQARLLHRLYQHLAHDAQYGVALAYLDALSALVQYAENALDKIDDRLWVKYHPELEKKREYVVPQYEKEPQYPEIDDDFELYFER